MSVAPAGALPTRHALAPREGALPTSVALHALPPPLCTQLDNWEATVPVLGWLFETAIKADQQLLKELYRYHKALRPLSVLDVLALLLIAGPGGERVARRVRLLATGSGEEGLGK